MSDGTIEERLKSQRRRIDEAARSAGRDPGEITIIAVSKKQSVDSIREAYAAGQRDFGENYVQELVTKAEELADLPHIRWHMIGHLQSNKCRFVAEIATWVHTVSSAKLAGELGRRVAQRRRMVAVSPDAARASGAGLSPSSVRPLAVLVEVNVSGEASKSGCSPDEVGEVLRAIDESPLLVARGLMTMAPAVEDPKDTVPFFQHLVRLRAEHGGAARLPELSFGMSHDAVEAVKCGATCVRIGTAIFGPRPT